MPSLKKISKNEIIIYKGAQGPELEVKVGANSIWLSQAQLAQLFTTDRSVITKHINNIFTSGELKEKSNVQKMHFASSTKPVKLYSLDTIISVGYRVNSKRATQFRIWATNVLRNYLTTGYAINEKKIKTSDPRLHELKKVVKLIEKSSDSKLLKSGGTDLMELLANYAHSLSLIDKFDRKKLSIKKTKKSDFKLSYSDALSVIKAIKKDLTAKQKASASFGKEVKHNLEKIIKDIFNSKVISGIEEQAAQILYRIIKDRPFTDGNKRIASFLFVYFLDRNNYLTNDPERKIDEKTLSSLTFLVAVSDKKDKAIVLKIIAVLLN